MRLPALDMLDRSWTFASGAVNIDLDLTAIAQLVLFTGFAVLMKPLVFDPLMRVFEERERRTVGAKKDARDLDEASIGLKGELDRKLEGIRRDAAVDREQIRSKLTRVQSELLAEARSEMQVRLEQGLTRVGDEVNATRKELDAQRGALASEIAGRVLGRTVAARATETEGA